MASSQRGFQGMYDPLIQINAERKISNESFVRIRHVAYDSCFFFIASLFATTMDKNNEKNDKFYRKVAFLMYTEMVNFRPQSLKAASKLKTDRGLSTRLPSS